MRKTLTFILLIILSSACGHKIDNQDRQLTVDTNRTTPTLSNFPKEFYNKIKDIEHFFVKRDLRQYSCDELEKYFYDNGTKINTEGLKEVDTTLYRQLFGNYKNDTLPIWDSYLFSIDKPIHNFYPITVILPGGVAERPIIMILFNDKGQIVNALEVANLYGEAGGCLSSEFINDSVLIQNFEWDEYGGVDAVSKKDLWEKEYLTKEVTITSKGKIIEKELKRWTDKETK